MANLLNKEQILSITRQVLMFLGGILVAKGWLTADELVGLIGPVLALAGVAWGIATHTDSAKLTAATKVMEDPARANAAGEAADKLASAVVG